MRAPWRSSESWSWLVWMTDSIDCGKLLSDLKRGVSWRRSGRSRVALVGAHDVLELLSGEAFVDDQRLAGLERAFEQLGRDLALGRVGGGELEGDRHLVGSVEQVEVEAQKKRAWAVQQP